MLVQLSPWICSPVPPNIRRTSKKGPGRTSSAADVDAGVLMVVSASSTHQSAPGGEHATAHKRRRLTAASHGDDGTGVVLTCPHAIALLRRTDDGDGDASWTPDWTVSSRPGAAHAYLPARRRPHDDEKKKKKAHHQQQQMTTTLAVPAVYDDRGRHLYALSDDNTVLRVYQQHQHQHHQHGGNNNNNVMEEEEEKRTLEFYGPNNDDQKKLSLTSLTVDNHTDGVVYCTTEDLRVIVVLDGGDSHEIFDPPHALQEFRAGTNRHLWTGFRRNNGASSDNMMMMSTVWHNVEQDTILTRHMVIVRSDDVTTTSRKLQLESDEVTTTPFHTLIGSTGQRRRHDPASVRVCALVGGDSLVFVYKNKASQQEHWNGFHCRLDYDDSGEEQQRPSRLRLHGSPPFTCCSSRKTEIVRVSALSGQIMAVLYRHDGGADYSVHLHDVTRHGTVLRSLPDLPLRHPLGMTGHRNTLVLYNEEAVAMSNLQLEAEVPTPADNNSSRSLTLAQLMRSSILNNKSLLDNDGSSDSLPNKLHPQLHYTSTNYKDFATRRICNGENSTVSRDTETKKRRKAIHVFLERLREISDPPSFLQIYQEAMEECDLATTITSTSTPRPKMRTPLFFAEPVCAGALKMLLLPTTTTERNKKQSTMNGRANTKPQQQDGDPLLHVLLDLMSTHPRMVSTAVLQAICTPDRKVVPSLVLLYHVLQMPRSCDGSVALTESNKVALWYHVLFQTKVEEVVHFYLFTAAAATTTNNNNSSGDDLMVKQLIEEYTNIMSMDRSTMPDSDKKRLKEVSQHLLSKAARDFSVKIIVDCNSSSCNDGLLRSALHQQTVVMDCVEVYMMVLMLSCLLQEHGPESLLLQTNKNYLARKNKMRENLIQWINAVLDVHGDKLTPGVGPLVHLQGVIEHELTVTKVIGSLQTCLQLVKESKSTTAGVAGSDGEKRRFQKNGSSSANGNLTTPGYCMERLRF